MHIRINLYFVALFLSGSFQFIYSEGINCTVSALGSTGSQYCDFYAEGSYRCEIEAVNIPTICSEGGSLWYACSLFVWKNGSYVAGTSGWLGQYSPWYYWSTWFQVNGRDHIEIFLVYDTMGFCLGYPVTEYSLTVMDKIHLGIIEEELNSEIPFEFNLAQNYPNPFNPNTTINYSLAEDSYVKLAVYNLLGEEISILVNSQQLAGIYNVEFNASELPGGIYLYRIETPSFICAKKLMLMK